MRCVRHKSLHFLLNAAGGSPLLEFHALCDAQNQIQIRSERLTPSAMTARTFRNVFTIEWVAEDQVEEATGRQAWEFLSWWHKRPGGPEPSRSF